MLNMLPTHSHFTTCRHGTIGENPDHPYQLHQALNSRFGYYTTSKGAGLANELDNDNGMLNKRPRPFTFLHQVTLHRHGTWGEAYAKPLNDRFGYYTTSKGIGFSGAMDYDNGMLNKRPRYHIQTMAPLERFTAPLIPALAGTPQAKALVCGCLIGTMITAC